MVTGVTYRNPAHLAKIVTTLDIVSAGRAILGIGAAWYDVEHEGLGFDFPPAGERLDRLEEALQICRAMFREDAPSFTGTHYRIHEARNIPRPVQPGGPTILVGGGGEKRTLRLVAQYADMCNFFGDAATFAHKVDVLRGHCKDVGRDPAEVTVSRLSTLVLTADEEETASTKDFLRQVGADPGGSDVGTADELVARVEELAAAGVEYFVWNMPTGTPDTVRRVGELLVGRFSRLSRRRRCAVRVRAAVVGIVVGIPLGIVAGRWLWNLFAEQIYAVPYPTVSVTAMVLVVVGTLILANVVAAIPARTAARTPTALMLRSE